MHDKLLDFCFKVLLCFCVFYIFWAMLCMHNLACTRRPILVCASCSPKTLILFVYCFCVHMFVLFKLLFICVMLHKFLFALFTCLFFLNMFRLGFIFLFLNLNAMLFIHMSMHRWHRCRVAAR